MPTPTWGDLHKYHCSYEFLCDSNGRRNYSDHTINPYYEPMAARRFNYSTSRDSSVCRLVFLQGVLEDSSNRTLCRNGRFIWCKSLAYEGTDPRSGLRKISFTIDKGKKRFTVLENQAVCLPSKSFINNNRYMKKRHSTFGGFGTVFGYNNTRNMMYRSAKHKYADCQDLFDRIAEDCPYRPGTLVRARKGYFYPDPLTRPTKFNDQEEYPYGIILAPSLGNREYCGREFYQVRFGQTTYDRIHPVEMEIINEV
jgi:hypothetical protein